MARKTAFVNEMILQSLKQNQQVVSPILKTVTKLDDKIKEVLDDNSLNEHSRVKKYSQVLQQYMNIRENLHTTDVTPTHVNNAVDSTSSTRPTPLYAEESIIETVPRTFRTRAKHLLRFIKNNDEIQWNNNGVVSYKDNVLQNSNIIDLVNDVIRPRKTSQPNNWQEFARALHEINIPKDLIGNPKRIYTSPTKESTQWVNI